MSVSRFPNPITTVFNPKAWDFELLNKFAEYFVTFQPQATLIAFQAMFFPTTVSPLSLANSSYTTSLVASSLTPFRTTANTWSGRNTLSATVSAPITISYSPVISANQIGAVISATLTTGAISPGSNPASIASLPLTVGRWLILTSINCQLTQFSTGGYDVSIKNGTTSLAYVVQNATNSLLVTMRASAIFSVASGTVNITCVPTLYQGTANYIAGSLFYAVRIA